MARVLAERDFAESMDRPAPGGGWGQALNQAFSGMQRGFTNTRLSKALEANAAAEAGSNQQAQMLKYAAAALADKRTQERDMESRRQFEARRGERSLERARESLRWGDQQMDALQEREVVNLHNPATGEYKRGYINQGKVFDAEGNPLGSEWVTSTSSAASKGADYNLGTSRERRSFEELGSNILAFDSITGSFKDSYVGNIDMLGTEGKEGVPGVGTVQNWVARDMAAIAPDDWKEQQLWWQSYYRNVENVERHELFGAALTKYEIEQWRKSTINPNMEAQQVKDALATQRRLKEKVMAHAADIAAAKGFPPDYISAVIRSDAGGDPGSSQGAVRTLTRSGTVDGRKVYEYSDGSVEYEDGTPVE